MKKLNWVLAIVIFILLFPATALAKAQPKLNIDPNCSYILIDSKTGQVLAENNADVKIRPASTTKILTALVALEEGKLDQTVKVSQQAVLDIGDGGMNIGIMADEENFTLEQMLNVMLVKSANETANIIGENVAASRGEFIKRINERAAELGALNTKFFNTCGMDDTEEYKNHLSTARDMAIIARQAMTIPKFREIVSQEYYKGLPATNKHKEWPAMRNTNKLLWDNNKYPYTVGGIEQKYTVLGIKTGYTSGAGHNLITSAVGEDGTELIAAVMHVTEGNDAVINYTKQLYKYGFENYKIQNIVAKNEVVETVTVEEAKDDNQLEIVASADLKSTLPMIEIDWKIEETKKINAPVNAPVKQGDILGYIEYKKDGINLGKVDLIASRSVEKSIQQVVVDTSKNIMSKIFSSIILKIVLFILLVLLIRKHIRRRNRRKRKAEYLRKKYR